MSRWKPLIVASAVVAAIVAAVLLTGPKISFGPSLTQSEVDRLGPFQQIMGMAIEKIEVSGDQIAIVTTGARYVLRNYGIMECWQRIPAKRKVSEIKFSQNPWPFSVSKTDEFSRVFTGGRLSLQISGDSVAILRVQRSLEFKVTGFIKPRYTASTNGKRNFIDSDGGFGYYPVSAKPEASLNLADTPWSFDQDFQSGEEAWFSVFSPRPYNWKKVLEPLGHTGKEEEPYSPPALIQEAAKHAKVFTLHSFFIPGGDKEPWYIPSFTPSDMGKFLKVRDQVQKAGMRFLIYASPYYSTAPDFFAEMKKLIHEYKIDGLYYDGISTDFRKSYQIIRHTRELLGDDIVLYVHASTDPFNSTQFFAPFIDTYADYILRGEAGRPASVSIDDFLRYVVSGLNISGANGYWLYYGSAVPNQKGEVFNTPDSKAIETAFRNHVYLPWSDTMYRAATKEQWTKFTEGYFQRLKVYQRKNVSSLEKK